MRLLIVWVFIFSPASSQAVTGPREVNGTLGESLSVQCRYDRIYENYDKYWCRGADRKCTILLRISPSEQEKRLDRVSIRADPSAHTFTVTMEELRAEDAGGYQCGIETVLYDPLFRVTVTVLPAVTGPREVSGMLGKSLSVQCHYEGGYKNNTKYWCRGADRSCTILVQTSLPERAVKTDRVSIRDDPSARTFTVTMEGLREEDAGSYHCGIQKLGVDPLFSVTVNVLPAMTGPREVNGTLGGSMSVQCQYKEGYENDTKFWCRGENTSCLVILQTSQPERQVMDRISIRDDPCTRTFTVTMEGLREEDAGSYQCGIEMHDLSIHFPVTVTVLLDEKIEKRAPFSAFNAVQVAQIGILLLCITVVSILCKNG